MLDERGGFGSLQKSKGLWLEEDDEEEEAVCTRDQSQREVVEPERRSRKVKVGCEVMEKMERVQQTGARRCGS